MVVDANDVLANMNRDASGNDLGTGGWAFPGNTQDGDTAHPNDYVGWNFVNNTNRPLDGYSHGTHTAGTIGAEGNNGVGVVGVNWVTQIMPLKWIADSGSGNDADAISAVNYSVLHGAKVSSNSWHIFDQNVGLYNAVKNARDHGDLFVAAAQNDAINNDTGGDFPAIFTRTTTAGPALDNVIAVAATDNRDGLASFSNYGLHTVQLGAPGVDVWSTFPTNSGSYAYDSGTSMATPHVAGAATLVWGYRPTSTYLDIKSAIVNGVDPIPSLNGKTVTGGRLNVFRSLQLVAAAGPIVVSQTPSGDNFGTVSSLRIGFSVPINPDSFTLDQIASFTRTVGGIVTDLLPTLGDSITITPVSGSNNQQFDISFTPQSDLGAYSMVIGPNILDVNGNAMDQDINGTPGEPGVAPLGDQYAATFNISGPKIIAQNVIGNHLPGELISSLQVTFNEPMNPATFTKDKITSFTGPPGATLAISSVIPVDTSNTRFNILFAPLTVTGAYRMVIGPNISDVAGHQMDQDGNGIPGEPGDAYTAQFGIAGLKVNSSTPTGNNNLPNTVSSVQVTFNEAVDATTFTLAQASLTGPNGSTPVPITAITHVGTSFTSFTLSFAPLTVTGSYHLIIGPNIQDTFGNQMDQDGNLIPGEPGDSYTTDFGIAGLKVVSSTPTGNNNLPSATNPIQVQVTFNESVNPTTFTPSQASLTIAGVAVPITAITPVAGSNNTRFTLGPALVATGSYHVVLGPNIQDTFGNAMDQDGNLIPGEPGDTYTADFGIAGPRITSSAMLTLSGPASSVRVTFNEAMDVATFTPAKIADFRGPNGVFIPVLGEFPVAGTSNTQFDIVFALQTASGAYTMVIGPDIHDVFGNAMDQNGNLVPGEIPGDRFTLTFTVPGPRITSPSAFGSFLPGVLSQVRVTFSEAMNATTFTPAKITSFTDPMGSPVAVTGVNVVPYTDNSQFDITFAAASKVGTYNMTIGPDIRDVYGNAMDGPFHLTFNILSSTIGTDGYGYTATALPARNLEILGQPGTFTIIMSSTFSSVPVNLGSDHVNFYGDDFTGNNQLFVSSNGLISFRQANNSSSNTDLQTSPLQAVIAPLWTFWGPSPGNVMVLGKFEDTPGGGRRLIIEWNQVRRSGSLGNQTFEVVLTLNTGSSAGDILFNYPNLMSGDSTAEGNNATAGLKAQVVSSGQFLPNPNRFLVNNIGTNPYVHTGQAILFSKGLKVTNIDASSVSLAWTWKPFDVVDGYKIERSTDGINFTQLGNPLGANVTTFTDTTVTAGGTYYYRVRAFSGTVDSPYSNVDSAQLATIDHSGGFASHGDLTANGSAVFTGEGAQLTAGPAGLFNQAGSVFSTSRVEITGFATSFTFQFTPGTTPVGNGITFVIQGDTPATVGASGGGMGYGPDTPSANRGIRNSVAVKFRSTNTTADPGNNTGLFTDGRSPSIPEAGSGDVNVPLNPAVINLSGPDPANPDPIQVDMTYDGTTLDVTITDTVTGGSLSQSYTVNIPALVGGNAAYVGFTGGTGGVHSAFQVIQLWTFQPSFGGGGGGGGSGGGAGSGPAPGGPQGRSSGPSASSDPPAGPSIISQAPNSNNFGTVSVLQVGFDEPINPSTFTLDQIVSFIRTVGSDVTDLVPTLIGVTPISSANQVFNISFAPQSALGVYRMVIGPHIQDLAGHDMDQDHNGIPGEDPSDEYTATFNIVGPKITAQNVTGNNNLPGMVNSLQVTFNESMNPLTFTPNSITFEGPNGPIAITGVSPVSGSNNTRFNITFAQLTRTGHYTMVIGPDIQDSFGNPMDQDGDFIPGEASDVYTALFGIAGLMVNSSTPTGNNNFPTASGNIKVTFNEAVNAATFTTSQVTLTGPGAASVPITAITQVNATTFRLSAQLVATGTYHLVVGPNIQDTFGNPMDQDNNLIPGEVPGDQYMASFGILGPRVTSPTSTINSSGPTFSVRVTFNEAMDVSTFTRDKIASFIGPNGASIGVSALAPVGTNPLNTAQFDIMFAPQLTTGTYIMVIGPDIRDLFGNKMDQDNNLIPGEVPQDQFTLRFTVPGPRITSPSSLGNRVAGFNDLQVTFNEPMQPGTFTPAKIASFTDPMGNPVAVTGVAVVPYTNNMTFDIQFNPAGMVGTYTMVIGPDIRDLYGNQMDQNGNFIPGEVPGDQFRLTFNITGPMAVSASPSGFQRPPVDHVRVTYNEPMNPGTFTTDLVSLTGPDGSPIDVTGIQPVAGSNNTQFDVSFDAQTTLGAYTMVIAAGVMDTFGNSAPAFTDHFTLANIINVLYVGSNSTAWRDTSLMNFTQISISQFATQSLAGFDELWIDSSQFNSGTILRNRAADIAAFVDAGGGLVTDDVGDTFDWVPNAASVTQHGGFCNDDVVITTMGQTHAIMAGLTNAGLSNWSCSWHAYFDPTGGMDVLATSTNPNQPLLLAGSFGSGRLVYFGGDPTSHWTQFGIPQAAQLLRQATLWAAGGGGGGGGGGLAPRRGRSAGSGEVAVANDASPTTTGDLNPSVGTTNAGRESGLTTLATGADGARALAGAYANLLSPGNSTSTDVGSGPVEPIPTPFDGPNTDLLPAPADAKARGQQQLAVALALARDWYDPLTDLGGLEGLAQLKHLNGKR
jgi:hypothetical protein